MPPRTTLNDMFDDLPTERREKVEKRTEELMRQEKRLQHILSLHSIESLATRAYDTYYDESKQQRPYLFYEDLSDHMKNAWELAILDVLNEMCDDSILEILDL